MPTEEKQSVGIWRQLHLQYIRQYKQVLYTELLMSGKLNSYLIDIDRQAEEMFFQLMDQMAEREGITEKLKEENQMLWVGKMSAIHNTEIEIVNNNLIAYNRSYVARHIHGFYFWLFIITIKDDFENVLNI